MPALPDYATFLQACARAGEPERALLETLLSRVGVAREYIEFSGNIAQIPFSDRVDVLQFMGHSLLRDGELCADLVQQRLDEAHRAEWTVGLGAATVLTPGGRDSVCLRLPHSALALTWQWTIRCEDGREFRQAFVPADLPETDKTVIDGVALSARALGFAPFYNGVLPLGYHSLSLHADGEPPLETSLIVAPARAFEPDWVHAGQRLWGFSVQLYTLRSSRNWGMGDFSDLQELLTLAAARKASFLVLNPLHALNVQAPEHCSPYSPNDRRRLNPLYIDLAIEPDYRDSRAVQTLVGSAAWQARLRDVKARDHVDYEGVAACKRDVLRLMFEHFLAVHQQPDTARARAFEAFVSAQGPSLTAFAAFEAQRYALAGDALAADPRFTLYAQWLAESQLAACQQRATALGMRIGLVRDLAVGGDGAGAEVNLNGALYCPQASIGAPPDPLAPQGQNWGLPPLNPKALEANGFRHFIELLQTNMAHCGALRIDHVMALMRLWWCPRYPGRGIGAYVHYPVEALFALLRLESVRHRCVVIGEDLGVVPPEVRTYISSSAIFSNILFYFEKYDGYHFKKPEHYAPRALAMVANHDVPTLAAWWNGSDLHLRYSLGLIPDEAALHQQLAGRRVEKQQVLRLLGDQWLLPVAWQGDAEEKPFDLVLCAALLRCCARAASQLLSVQLEDLALLESPVNIPGTSSEYPNWRRRLPAQVDALIDSPAGTSLLAGLQEERNPT